MSAIKAGTSPRGLGRLLRRQRRGGSDQLITRVDGLVESGRSDEAVDLLADHLARSPDGALELKLRDLRHVAGVASQSQTPRADWPPQYPDPFPDLEAEIPEAPAADLTTELMGGSVASHGCLLVRQLFDDAQAAETLASVKQAQARMGKDLPPDEWYSRFEVEHKGDVQYRKRVESNGGTWLADSPHTTSLVMRTMRSIGVADVMATHFGERPVFSLQKSTLRCMAPEARLTAWHQDGSFLDETVRTMNVWVALSACGGDHPASGLEIIPKRMTEYLPLAPELAKAAVSFEAVDELMREVAPARPEFLPGDALIFDERLLHHTDLGPGLTEDRYALECWFFAPSHATARYTPFLA